MKFLIYTVLLIISAPFYTLAQIQEENEKEGKLLKEFEKERLEMLYKSAGTRNLSLVNYRAFNKQKEVQRAAGPAGYTSFNGNWTQIPLAQSDWGMGRINCFAVHPTDANTIFAGTPTGGLWKTTNNGSSWQNLTSAMQVPGVSGICINPQNPDIMYILTGSASSVECQSLGVFKTVDGGANWLPTGLDTAFVTDWFPNGSFNAHKLIMDVHNSQHLYAAMTTGLYRTGDGGDTWVRVIDDIGVRDVAFHPTNPNIIYAVTDNRSVRISVNYGGSFPTNQLLLRPSHVGNYSSCTMAVSQAAPDSVFFVTTVPEPVSGISIDSVYVVRAKFNSGSNTLSFSRFDKCFYGTTQSEYVASALRWYRDARLTISPSTTAQMYISGLETYSTSDYGKNWRRKSVNGAGQTTIHTDGTQINYVNGYVYASNDGGIYRQPASASSSQAVWDVLTGTMPIAQIYKIGAGQTNTTNFVLALQDNGCHLRTNLTYNLLNGGDGLMARMSPTTPGTYYYRINNYVTVRVKAGNSTNINPENTNGYVFLPFEVDQGNESRIYTAYKDLYISPDEGTTWNKKVTGATRDNKLMAVSKSNNNVFWLLEDKDDTHDAVLRRTTNGGSSFQTIPLPAAIPVNLISQIVISPSDENRVYLAIDGYNTNAKVFLTINGSAAIPANITWTNLASNTLPNVPVYCLAYESTVDNSIYIGTEIGVYYYNSTFNRWISFNNGMPVCRLSELYINHASLKIIAATYGRGIFISDLYTDCATTLSVSGAQSGTLTYSASNTLSSTAELSGGEASRIKYYGGINVYLNPGFKMGPGTNFIAAIGPCGGNIDPILNKLIKDSAALKSNRVNTNLHPLPQKQDTRHGNKMEKNDADAVKPEKAEIKD